MFLVHGAAGGRTDGGAPLVLVVEDNEHNLKLTCDLLRFEGIETAVARTVADGVALARSLLPDLVLMDLRLPDGSGIDALDRLRAHEATASLEVVVVTSSAMVGDRERLLAAGFDGYIAKPIEARTFGADIASRVRSHALSSWGHVPPTG